VVFNAIGFAQCQADLEKHTAGFTEVNAAQFSFLDSIFDSAKVIGYREDTHFTSTKPIKLIGLIE
jgi:hypothetical protein